jgi:hypothetical protein
MKKLILWALIALAATATKASNETTIKKAAKANTTNPWLGTLPVMFINTSVDADISESCTYIDGYYFAYFENADNWSDVHCYVWDQNFNNLNGDWTGKPCEKVGTAANGHSIWRWVSSQKISEAQAPYHIIFNDGQQVGKQTADLLVANGGYYTPDMQKEEAPDIKVNSDGTTNIYIPIESKEEYVRGTYYIDALGLEGYESLGDKDNPMGLQIKGRGNYTWTGFNKKPYRLKFDEKATPLGMKKSKHFNLQAHADDRLGFLRNTVGFELSRMLGLEYTPEQQPVEVVLNGDYIGLYFLTDHIRVDKDRVNITEQADNETDPEAITGGWLMEIDNYEEDPQVRIKEGNGQWIWVTPKSPEALSTAQYDYLEDLIVRANNAIYAKDKNSTEWESIIDIDALARYYIVQEVMDDGESFHGSCYIHKDRGEDTKMVFGPVWDFGNALMRGTNKFIYQDPPFTQIWIGEIAKYPRFQERVKEIWQHFYGNKFPKLDAFIDNFAKQISDAAVSNAKRWPEYGNSNMNDCKNDFKYRIEQKTNFLRSQWGEGIIDEEEEIVDGMSGIRISENNISNRTTSANQWYTIDGQMLSERPSKKGIYINNGKKVVVR